MKIKWEENKIKKSHCTSVLVSLKCPRLSDKCIASKLKNCYFPKFLQSAIILQFPFIICMYNLCLQNDQVWSQFSFQNYAVTVWSWDWEKERNKKKNANGTRRAIAQGVVIQTRSLNFSDSYFQLFSELEVSELPNNVFNMWKNIFVSWHMKWVG